MATHHRLGITIGVGNQKGGAGKSTVSVHLAAALGLRGYQCLVLDLDPAAGSTRHLGVPASSFAGTLELLTTNDPLSEVLVTDGLPENVHLVAARPQLSELETMLSKFVDRTRILDRALGIARHLYDFIILDTPPSAAAVTTVAAYASAEWFLLTAFPHPLSIAGLTEAFKDISDVRDMRNRDLEVLGIAFTNVDGRARRLRSELNELLQTAMPGRRFRTSISQTVAIPTMSGQGKTLFQHPQHDRLPAARQFRRLADEVEHRARNREAFLRGSLGDPEIWDSPPSLTAADALVDAG